MKEQLQGANSWSDEMNILNSWVGNVLRRGDAEICKGAIVLNSPALRGNSSHNLTGYEPKRDGCSGKYCVCSRCCSVASDQQLPEKCKNWANLRLQTFPPPNSFV